MNQGYHKSWKFMRRLCFMVIGAFLASIGLELFLIPNHIIDGGIVGISIMLSFLSSLPLGFFLIILNIPFIYIGYKQIGRTFAFSTLFSISALSVSVFILHHLHMEKATDDVWLATVFGGIILGIGVGIIIRNGGSLDGTEIVAIILDKRTGFSIGEIIMFFNIFILTVSGFIFGWDNAMYSLLAYYIAFKVIDVTVEGLNETKGVFIVSNYHEELSNAIMSRLGRSVTLLKGQGGYKKELTNVIYVIVTRLEIAKLKEIILEVDKDALVTIGNVELIGRKYPKKAIH